ncbi:unnamed protein product, partial [Choristocarpus tenellus]
MEEPNMAAALEEGCQVVAGVVGDLREEGRGGNNDQQPLLAPGIVVVEEQLGIQTGQFDTSEFEVVKSRKQGLKERKEQREAEEKEALRQKQRKARAEALAVQRANQQALREARRQERDAARVKALVESQARAQAEAKAKATSNKEAAAAQAKEATANAAKKDAALLSIVSTTSATVTSVVGTRQVEEDKGTIEESVPALGMASTGTQKGNVKSSSSKATRDEVSNCSAPSTTLTPASVSTSVSLEVGMATTQSRSWVPPPLGSLPVTAAHSADSPGSVSIDFMSPIIQFGDMVGDDTNEGGGGGDGGDAGVRTA